MFAIVIGGNDTAVLMRDPLGIKRCIIRKSGWQRHQLCFNQSSNRKNGMIAEFPRNSLYTGAWLPVLLQAASGV